MRRLPIVLLAAQAALPACNSGSPRQLQPPVAIEGVRTEGDRSLLLTFVGSSPNRDPSDPCWVGYRPEVTESEARVVVTIRTFRSPVPAPESFACTAEGYFRAVVVELSRPLGERRLVDGATDLERRPFDGATLLRPRFLPPGFGLLREGPGGDEPERSATWMRTWGPAPVPPRDGQCADPVSPVTLSQGPPRGAAGSRAGETVALRAGTGTVVREERAGASLTWFEQGQELVLASSPPCATTPPADPSVLVQIAEGLERTT